MRFVGLDLTSAFSAEPRPVDIAILDDDLGTAITFARVRWPDRSEVVGRDLGALEQMIRNYVGQSVDQVWAIDGPQALARLGTSERKCETLLATPGRTPATLPDHLSQKPFQSYIRSSLDLFGALLAVPNRFRLKPSVDPKANLMEVFPGSEFRALAGCRIGRKTSQAGRRIRRSLLAYLGIRGLPDVPTADQNDAAIAAYLAWCTLHRSDGLDFIGDEAFVESGHLREGKIAHLNFCLGGWKPPDLREDVQRATAPPASDDRDWNEEQGDFVLRFTDTGLVHGAVPENRWLVSGKDYDVVTADHFPTVAFRLVHSTAFAGGRGWRCEPSVKAILVERGQYSGDLKGVQSVRVPVRLPR